jgi:SAM-dependent methyltransferase
MRIRTTGGCMRSRYANRHAADQLSLAQRRSRFFSMPPNAERFRPLSDLKRVVARLPLIGPLARSAWTRLQASQFRDSASYWEKRYAAGGNSGQGSYDYAAQWKAQTVNALVRTYQVRSVIEFGCGDGQQLSLGEYPSYIGTDISQSAVARCILRFASDNTKSFLVLDPRLIADPLRVLHADMSLSLDVLFHLVEDEARNTYLKGLFRAADRLVVIYSSNGPIQLPTGPHERHREFTSWVRENCHAWQLIEEIRSDEQAERLRTGVEDGGAVHFFVYSKR